MNLAKPCPTRPELEQLIREAQAWFDALSPAEQAAHCQAQRESWARGERAWPKPTYTYVNGVKVYASYADYCNG